MNISQKLTRIQVLDRAHAVHGYKYIYDKMEYIDAKTKICITCREHGDFWQIPYSHFKGYGCPQCGNERIGQKLSQGKEKFITRAKEVHGDKYIYDENKINYVNNDTKVPIICPKHGEFWQSPKSHLRGSGCPACGGKIRYTTETYVPIAMKVHNGKYIYHKTNYVNAKTDICITCPIHGDFWQNPYNHMHGAGCPKCIGQGKTTESFIAEADKIHKGKYIYDKTEYIDAHTKTCVTCRIHGDFMVTPNGHLRGSGCPKCGGTQKITTEEFIAKAKEVHGDEYIYDDTVYVNNKTKIIVTCRIHGNFETNPGNHLKGVKCPKCAGGIRYTKEDFVERARKVHGDDYIYDDVVYVNSITPVDIICKKHGKFSQTPGHHLNGCGCPKCCCAFSKSEEEIFNFISDECHLETKSKDRKLLDGLESDVIVPSHNLIIEFDGLHWHTENNNKDKNYHLNKTELAKSKGYHLIHIFEDEWLEHKDIVLSKIRHILGCDTDKPVVGARKCTIKTLSKALSEEFLTTYHLQGFSPSTALYGAFYGDTLVGVMTFKKEKEGIWNFNRFATNTGYRLPGLASKMFKQFIKDNNPTEVKAFLDRRWSHCDSNLYDKLGFKLEETIQPDYWYVVKKDRLPKTKFSKQILSKEHNLPLTMTEKEMAEKLGYHRIWDCGMYKYIWRKAED